MFGKSLDRTGTKIHRTDEFAGGGRHLPIREMSRSGIRDLRRSNDANARSENESQVARFLDMPFGFFFFFLSFFILSPADTRNSLTLNKQPRGRPGGDCRLRGGLALSLVHCVDDAILGAPGRFLPERLSKRKGSGLRSARSAAAAALIASLISINLHRA